MPDTNVQIRISAVGGDDAASALEKSRKGMDEVGDSSTKLEEKFSHRFQHMGLQLFAGDALHAIGLGSETRIMINTLNMALAEGEAAFGVASGGAMLLVTALGALVGIIAKVSEKAKDHNDQIQKLNETNHQQLDATTSVIESINNYIDATGQVPGYLSKWEQSEKDLQQAQIDRQIAGDKAQISSLTVLNNTERLHVASLKEQIDSTERLITSLKAMGVDQGVIIAQTGQLSKLKDEYSKQSLEVQQNKAKVDELIASIKMLRESGTDDVTKLTDAEKEQTKEREEALKKYQENMKEEAAADTARFQHWAELRQQQLAALQKEQQEEVDAENKRYEMGAKLHAQDVANHRTSLQQIEVDERVHSSKMVNMHQQMYTIMSQLGNEFLKAQGDAFAKMIIEGKSFTDSMRQAFRNMAEQFISYVEQMIVKWLAFLALKAATGGATGFLGMAEGGSVLVQQPTMFLAGEAGQPEIATFTPLSKLGSGQASLSGVTGQSGGSISIGNIQTNIYGVSDPDEIADSVGRKIIERIRGMGEQNFTRVS